MCYYKYTTRTSECVDTGKEDEVNNKKLKDRRAKLGLTQASVASSVGISARAYQNYEIGQRIPNVEVAMLIAKILKCKVEDIFSISHAQTNVNTKERFDD